MDQRLDAWDLSLDAPVREDSETDRMSFLGSEATSAEDEVARKQIENMLHDKIAAFTSQLNERELEIFEKRIFSDEPVTLQEIGEAYGISRERVRQIEKGIIKKMQTYFQKELPDFDVYTSDAL
jgi:RNA polymerase sigma-32 factor